VVSGKAQQHFLKKCTRMAGGPPDTLLRRISGATSERESRMSKAKSTPMTSAARSRIVSAAAKIHDGKIPADSFASRADAILQRQVATGGTSKTQKK
jgi:hypothetical protein